MPDAIPNITMRYNGDSKRKYIPIKDSDTDIHAHHTYITHTRKFTAVTTAK